jgi:hypothetical protein
VPERAQHQAPLPKLKRQSEHSNNARLRHIQTQALCGKISP